MKENKKKANRSKRRFSSLNAAMALFVFLILVCASAISFLIFKLLALIGVVNDYLILPGAAPIVMISSCVIIGSILAVFLFWVFLRPVEKLARAMKRVSKGDYSVRLDKKSRMPWLHELQSNFDLMASELDGNEMFRNDFINDFSHEFKTPMVSVYGFAKQLKKGGLTKEQESEYIDIILAESKRLIDLSANVLFLNKLENQRIISDKQMFSLDEEIRRSILQLEEQWSAKNIEMIPQLEDITYFGSADILKNVWLNVIGNAVKFTDRNGEIIVSCHKTEDEIRVTVKDNGIGMDEETKRRIFEKFWQGDNSRQSGGNGLGLAMVKRIVELCSGRCEVMSASGQGTEFSVILPSDDGKTEEKKRLNLPAIDIAGLK